MNWIPLPQLVLLLGMCVLVVHTFSLKYDVKTLGEPRQPVFRRSRSSSNKRHGNPDHESVRRQAEGYPPTTSNQANKDVKSQDRQPLSDYTSPSHTELKFEDSRRVLRAENSQIRDERNEIGRSDALLQEVSKSDIGYSAAKMVVVASTTIAALFGMCVMAAIFQCCCRKKRTTSESGEADAIKREKKEEKQKSKSPTPEKDVSKTAEGEEISENDKLLEDEELGDFSLVQRETEILKSYRKPPPPKNRARASRVPRAKAAASKEDIFALIQEESEGGSIKSKPGSQRSTPDRKVSKEEPEPEPETKQERRTSFESAQRIVDSMFAEVKGEITPKKPESEPEPEEPTKDDYVEPVHLNGVQPNGGNIFMQIDPTVRIKDPNEKKNNAKATKIPVKAPQSSPSPSRDEANLRPTSANKEQRKFFVPSVHGEQMDQLVKSLKTRLKDEKNPQCQSARNLASSTVTADSGNDDDTGPQSRERSHSDPMKNLLGVKQTHV